MCGIIGYTGPLDSKKILLNGLSQLEYRGYDSAGVALCMENSHICLVRRTGKVANLRDDNGTDYRCLPLRPGPYEVGDPRRSDRLENAHPHQAGKVTLVHNGIIENYHQLTEQFHLQGRLHSETDSEVAAWVLDSSLPGRPAGGHHPSCRLKLKALTASVSCSKTILERSTAMRNVSPLVAAYTRSGSFVASDSDGAHPLYAAVLCRPGRSHRASDAPTRSMSTIIHRHEEMPEIDGSQLEHGCRHEKRISTFHAEGDPRTAGGAEEHHPPPLEQGTARFYR